MSLYYFVCCRRFDYSNTFFHSKNENSHFTTSILLSWVGNFLNLESKPLKIIVFYKVFYKSTKKDKKKKLQEIAFLGGIFCQLNRIRMFGLPLRTKHH